VAGSSKKFLLLIQNSVHSIVKDFSKRDVKTIALCSICFLFYAFKQTVRDLPHRNVESGLTGLNRRLGEKTSLLLPENSSQIKPLHGKKVRIIVLSMHG